MDPITELMTLNSMGMVLILISWILQIMQMLKGKMEVTKPFALLQFLGIAVIAAGLFSTSTTVALLNMLSAIGALVVLLLLLKPKK